VERRIEKAKKNAKGDKKYLREAEVFEALRAHLDAGKPARSFEGDEEALDLIAASDLLSAKPIIYAANLDEDTLTGGADKNPHFLTVKALAESEGAQVLPVSAKMEAEIAQLPGEDREIFLQELGLAQSGLDRLIQCSYTLLGLISYLTAGEDEVRAWTIRKGTKAPQAAGKIHTDFERGFIRAEVIAFDDLKAAGSMTQARSQGLIRSEGKEYVMQDGDVVLFRFNV